jgi:shikimate kinase
VRNITLIGFMGTGKSTVSHYLGKKMGMEEIEIDEMIVKAEKMPITEIFAKYGEEYFRDCESRAILQLQNKTGAVISCGGGAVIREENVRNLKKSSQIVLLYASPETILERVRDSTKRPILNGHMNVAYISELMEKRLALYEKAADIKIVTDQKSVEAVCQEILSKLDGIE